MPVASELLLPDRELGWLAGLLEGEGSFFRAGRGDLVVSASNSDREILERIKNLCGGSVGISSRPGDKSHRLRSLYKWRASGAKAASIMYAVYPLMTKRRCHQIEDALGDTWTSYLPLPRRLA